MARLGYDLTPTGVFDTGSPGTSIGTRTILGGSPEDARQQRLQLLLQEAQLRNLRLDPVFKDRQLSQDRELALSGQEVQRHGQQLGYDATTRGQDLTAKAQKEQNDNTTLNTLIAHAAARPDVPASVFADFAGRLGHPELQDAFGAIHTKEITARAEPLLGGLKAAQATGDTKGYKAFYDQIQADGEVLEHIKKTAPEYLGTQAGTKPTIGGPDPYAADPEFAALAPAIAKQQQQDLLDKELRTKQAAADQRASELARRRKRVGLDQTTPGLPTFRRY